MAAIHGSIVLVAPPGGLFGLSGTLSFLALKGAGNAHATPYISSASPPNNAQGKFDVSFSIDFVRIGPASGLGSVCAKRSPFSQERSLEGWARNDRT